MRLGCAGHIPSNSVDWAGLTPKPAGVNRALPLSGCERPRPRLAVRIGLTILPFVRAQERAAIGAAFQMQSLTKRIAQRIACSWQIAVPGRVMVAFGWQIRRSHHRRVVRCGRHDARQTRQRERRIIRVTAKPHAKLLRQGCHLGADAVILGPVLEIVQPKEVCAMRQAGPLWRPDCAQDVTLAPGHLGHEKRIWHAVALTPRAISAVVTALQNGTIAVQTHINRI